MLTRLYRLTFVDGSTDDVGADGYDVAGEVVVFRQGKEAGAVLVPIAQLRRVDAVEFPGHGRPEEESPAPD